jgi:UDP-glucose 4-epimerase
VRIIVTGAAGYIGSVTSRLLLEAGHEVVGIDDFSQGQRANLPAGITLLEADFADLEALSIQGQFDACLHFAAKSVVAESESNPEKYIQTNVTKTRLLLNFLQSNGCRKFVFSSTASVYGDSSTSILSEAAGISPANVYARSKAVIEEDLQGLSSSGVFKTAILRYFNAAGSFESHSEHHSPESHLIPLILEVASGQNQSLNVYGNDYPTSDGTCVRDYVHVYDIARAHILALNYLETHQELTVNVGAAKGYSVLEVIAAVEKVTGKKIPYNVAARRSGDPATLVADITKAKQLLDWSPEHSSLEEIVSSAWNALEKN